MDIYVNPYYGVDFFQFFAVLVQRVLDLQTPLVADEIQMLTLSMWGCSAACLGSFLMYRKETMVANSISHTVLLGIVISYLVVSYFYPVTAVDQGIDVSLLLLSAIVTGFLTVSLIRLLNKMLKVQLDASNGLIFNFLFALGIVLVTVFFRNSHVGLELLTGNVDSLAPKDMHLSAYILLFSLLCVVPLFKYWKVFVFDQRYARIIGVRVGYLQILFTFLLALNIVGAIRAVGILMMLSLVTAPAICARALSFRLKRMLVLASLISVTSSLVGVAMSRHLLSVYSLPISTGALVVCILFFAVFVTLLFSYIKNTFTAQDTEIQNNKATFY
ncbi:MAG: iron chelate uptake ABC transporter family permease subunit [Chlamydiales bacterium]|nr:iron chelate uptake ABC transporter family permease subunit [Chlamydiales bacterium]